MHCPEVEIVYIDETTFNLWQAPSRVWLKEGMQNRTTEYKRSINHDDRRYQH